MPVLDQADLGRVDLSLPGHRLLTQVLLAAGPPDPPADHLGHAPGRLFHQPRLKPRSAISRAARLGMISSPWRITRPEAMSPRAALGNLSASPKFPGSSTLAVRASR